MFDSYRWIKAFKRSRAINRVHEAKLPDEGFSDPDQMRNEQFSPTEQRMIKQIMSAVYA